MIFQAEYSMELNNGKVGKRKGPILIPDTELQNLVVEPLFTTSSSKYSATQCLISSMVIGTKIIDYNVNDLQRLIEDKLHKKQEVRGFYETGK